MRLCSTAILLSACLWPFNPATAQALQRLAGQTMGTTWQVTLTAGTIDRPRLQDGVQDTLDQVVAEMSTWEPDSDISRFNRADAGTRQGLPEGFFHVLQAAVGLAESTGGAYDPTVGPLVELWGFGPGGRRAAPPPDDAIEAVRQRTGWQQLALDPEHRTVLQPGGLHLDLSSIAKGHGVDVVARYLDGQGIDGYLVDVGGELRAHGRKPDGSPWRIAIEHPAPDDGAAGGATPRLSDIVVEPGDGAVATSGDYRHYFEADGQRYSHTLDPRTGRPVTHGLASVTVLHREAMQADGLATALTVLGPDEGWDYATSRGLAALFVTHDGTGFQTRMTPAFRARLASP